MRTLTQETGYLHRSGDDERNIGSPRSRPYDAVVVAAFAALAAIAVAVATSRYGIGVTPDSVVYVRGGHNLAEHGAFGGADGAPITFFAPGYSAALAVAELVDVDHYDAARIISALAGAATVVLAYILLRRHVQSRALRWRALVVVSCSAVLLEVYTKALSEVLFVPVVLGFLIVCEAMLERPLEWRLFGAAVVLSWCAFYLRYAGLVTWAVGALIFLVALWSRHRGSALARASLFLLASAAMPALWMLRNIDADGDPLGPRYDAARSLTENVFDTARELSLWTATGIVPSFLRLTVFAGVIAVLGAIAIVSLTRPGSLDVVRPLLPIGLFAVIYVVYLVTSASLVAFRDIDTRLLLPVFIPLVVAVAWLLDGYYRRAPEPTRTLLSIGCVVVVALNIAWFADKTMDLKRVGAGGYAKTRWQESQLMRDVERLDLSAPTVSNDIRAIEFFVGTSVATSPAKRQHAESGEHTSSIGEFVHSVECSGRVQLVWFTPNQRPHLYSPAELSDHVDLRRVIERSDGAVYELRPVPGSAGACDRP